MKNKTLAILAITLLSALAVKAQIAQGGTYKLEQAVIASGGGSSFDAVNNTYSVSGTAGQSSAGDYGYGGTYTQHNGFWNADALSPTAAAANVGGRVLNPNNTGVANVVVTLIGGSLTAPRVTRTNAFGNFQFNEIESGQSYVVTVQSKKYGFAQSSQAFSLTADLTNMIFRADWRN